MRRLWQDNERKVLRLSDEVNRGGSQEEVESSLITSDAQSCYVRYTYINIYIFVEIDLSLHPKKPEVHYTH